MNTRQKGGWEGKYHPAASTCVRVRVRCGSGVCAHVCVVCAYGLVLCIVVRDKCPHTSMCLKMLRVKKMRESVILQKHFHDIKGIPENGWVWEIFVLG